MTIWIIKIAQPDNEAKAKRFEECINLHAACGDGKNHEKWYESNWKQ